MRSKIGMRLVNSLSPDNQDQFVWDTETAGFGLKITATGRIVYILQSRVGGNRTHTDLAGEIKKLAMFF